MPRLRRSAVFFPATGNEFIFVLFSGLCTQPAVLTQCSEKQGELFYEKSEFEYNPAAHTRNPLLPRQISLHKHRDEASISHRFNFIFSVWLYYFCICSLRSRVRFYTARVFPKNTPRSREKQFLLIVHQVSLLVGAV